MASFQSKLRDLSQRMFSRKEPLSPESKIIALRQREDQQAQRRRYHGPAQIAPVTIGAMSAEWVRPPKAEGHRVVLYLHGGGYCFGSRDTHRSLVAQLCQAAEARGLVIDYRLAPEHPFPAALDDAVSAYRWLLGQGISPSGIALAGDSAGGGLAIATTMALRDGGAPLPRAIVTMSPWTDLALTGWTVLTNAGKDPNDSWETLAVCARHYLKNTLPTNPFASPFYGNFRGLPPLLLHAGSDELLRDDATRVAEKAEAAGVDVSCEIWAGMHHVFQMGLGLPEAQGSLERIGSFIKSRVPATSLARAADKSGRTGLFRRAERPVAKEPAVPAEPAPSVRAS